MVTSIKNLKNEVDNRLTAGGLEELACCQLQNAQTILNDNIVHSVSNTASLPNNISNEGRFIYVQDIKEYRLANDSNWTDDVSSGICTYRTQLLAWGTGNSGNIGDGTTNDRCIPTLEISNSPDWCQVTSNGLSTLALKKSGQIWGWGSNSCGSLGDGTQISRCSPVREFCSATDWCQVSTGLSHTVAVKTSGQLWAWGVNSSGTLGDGTAAFKFSPVRERCSATDWCQVSAGINHTLAVKTSGQLWAWGNNDCGQLGDGTLTTRCSPVRERCFATDWCQVSAGWCHTAAIKTSGQLWIWGIGTCGIIGDGTTITRCSPVREFYSATDWCQVSSSLTRHAIALKTSGELWAWGYNTGGRLGDGTTISSCSPVREFCSAADWCQASAGQVHSIAVKTSGQLWAWGNGNCGQLGNGASFCSSCSPIREISYGTSWCQASAGNQQSAAIKLISKGFLE